MLCRRGLGKSSIDPKRQGSRSDVAFQATWALHSCYMDHRGLGRVLDALFGAKPKPKGYDLLPMVEQVDAALTAALGGVSLARLRRLDAALVSEPLEGCAVCGRPAKMRPRGPKRRVFARVFGRNEWQVWALWLL